MSYLYSYFSLLRKFFLSLGIAFKGPEGIVLAADSRVTLTGQKQTASQQVLVPATFDNATKMLHVVGQQFAGAVTYGLGVIGQQEPRTAHSFMPEFEDELKTSGRLSVEDFAKKLSAFFMRQWDSRMPKDYKGPDLIFLVGGYDEGAPYGRVFEVHIPSSPSPHEHSTGTFGVVWGGQRQFTDRLIQGFDPRLPKIVQESLSLSDDQTKALTDTLRGRLGLGVPYPFLPLQDCVDLAIFLIRTTMKIQTWLVDVRGVGGAIDVATITRTEGFKAVQQKTIIGERT